jgi:hypothetical protein
MSQAANVLWGGSQTRIHKTFVDFFEITPRTGRFLLVISSENTAEPQCGGNLLV